MTAVMLLLLRVVVVASGSGSDDTSAWRSTFTVALNSTPLIYRMQFFFSVSFFAVPYLRCCAVPSNRAAFYRTVFYVTVVTVG